jgi:hypothetical protein
MTGKSDGIPPVPRTFHIPEHALLRRLREMVAIRGDGSTPEDSARIAVARFLSEFLRLAAELKRRVEAGERCRIVEVPQPPEPGTMHVKFKIELESQ